MRITRILRSILLSSLVIFQCAQAGAQEDNLSLFEYAPFVVESTRLGTSSMDVSQAFTAVDQQGIQRANQQITLDETMQGTPGVFVLNPHNYAQDTRIAIRGFGARADFGIRGIKLLIDGIPATTPDGQGEVDGMDLGSTERIEVLRGPSAAYYGTSSGGVILLVGEAGPADPFIETRLTVGDYGMQHWQFKAGGESGQLNYLLSAGHLASDGYRANSETENTRVNGRLQYQLTESQRLRLVFNVIDFPEQNDAGGLTRNEAMANPRQARDRNLQFDSGESVTQERVGIVYEASLSDTHAFEVSAFSTHRDFSNRLPFESGGQVSFDRQFSGLRGAYTYSGERWRFSTGIDLDNQDDDRLNYDNLGGERGPVALNQNETVKGYGIFAIYEQELSGSLRLATAIRYDRIDFEVLDRLPDNGNDSGSIRFSETSPSIGLAYALSKEVVIYTNTARSFETPTTTEFDNPDGGGFNLNLKSQQAQNYEIGSRGSFLLGALQLAYSVALFHLEIEDALVPYELPEFPGREFFRNAGESTRRGLEASIRTALGRHLVVGIDYTWSDFSYDRFITDSSDYSGNVLPGIPRHFGNIFLRYESESGLFATWKTHFIGSFYANDANREAVSGYSVTDLRAGYLLTSGNWQFEPFIAVLNVLDRGYFSNVRINAFGGRHFEPAPGRNYFAGLRVRCGF